MCIEVELSRLQGYGKLRARTARITLAAATKLAPAKGKSKQAETQSWKATPGKC